MRRPNQLGILAHIRRRPRGLIAEQLFLGGGGLDPNAVHVGDAAGGDVGGTFPTSLTVPGLAGKQPLDADLTNIAALTTTTFGRGLLTLADSAALAALLPFSQYQPIDQDLTDIAALTTTAFGRSLLTLADAAALAASHSHAYLPYPFPEGQWLDSLGGEGRLYFVDGGHTYVKSPGGSIILRAGGDADTFKFEPGPNVRLLGDSASVFFGASGDLSLVREGPIVGSWPTAHLTSGPLRVTGGLGLFEAGDHGAWIDDYWHSGLTHTLAFYPDVNADQDALAIIAAMRWSVDTQPRFTLRASGLMTWGDGTGANMDGDANLRRSAAAELATSASFWAAAGDGLVRFIGARDVGWTMEGGLRVDENAGDVALRLFPTEPTTDKVVFLVSSYPSDYDYFRVRGHGKMEWGPGSVETDTELFRGAANRLQTTDDFLVQNPDGSTPRAITLQDGSYLAGLSGGGTQGLATLFLCPALSHITAKLIYLSAFTDQYPRFTADGNGRLEWGTGAAASPDNYLERQASGQLKTGSKLFAVGLDAGDQKITNVADGSAADDATAWGQVSGVLPTADQKLALAGSHGTPGAGNPYVTEADPRVTMTQIPLTDAIAALEPVHYLMHTSGLTDLGSSGSNGSLNGGLSQNGSPVTSDGINSWDCDGSDDFVSSAWSGFDPGDEFTFVMFIQRDGNDADWFFGDANGTYAVGLLNGGTAHVYKLPPVGSATFGPAAPALNTPYMLAWRGKGGTAHDLFINGLTVEHTVGTPDFSSSGGGFYIGRASTSYVNAKIAHMAVFDKQLTNASLGWIASIGLGLRRDYGIVAQLPPNALWGDRCTYVADQSSGVLWELVYDGQGTYPWKAIGGAKLQDQVGPAMNSNQSTSSASYTNLTTTGPSITLPLAGDYDVGISVAGGIYFGSGSGQIGYMSYAIGGTGAVDADAIWGGEDPGTLATIGREARKTGLAASTTLQAKYRSNTGTQVDFYGPRRIWATPVRVG